MLIITWNATCWMYRFLFNFLDMDFEEIFFTVLLLLRSRHVCFIQSWNICVFSMIWNVNAFPCAAFFNPYLHLMILIPPTLWKRNRIHLSQHILSYLKEILWKPQSKISILCELKKDKTWSLLRLQYVRYYSEYHFSCICKLCPINDPELGIYIIIFSYRHSEVKNNRS